MMEFLIFLASNQSSDVLHVSSTPNLRVSGFDDGNDKRCLAPGFDNQTKKRSQLGPWFWRWNQETIPPSLCSTTSPSEARHKPKYLLGELPIHSVGFCHAKLSTLAPLLSIFERVSSKSTLEMPVSPLDRTLVFTSTHHSQGAKDQTLSPRVSHRCF